MGKLSRNSGVHRGKARQTSRIMSAAVRAGHNCRQISQHDTRVDNWKFHASDEDIAHYRSAQSNSSKVP